MQSVNSNKPEKKPLSVKGIRKSGRCPATEKKQQEKEEAHLKN